MIALKRLRWSSAVSVTVKTTYAHNAKTNVMELILHRDAFGRMDQIYIAKVVLKARCIKWNVDSNYALFAQTDITVESIGEAVDAHDVYILDE